MRLALIKKKRIKIKNSAAIRPALLMKKVPSRNLILAQNTSLRVINSSIFDMLQSYEGLLRQ